MTRGNLPPVWEQSRRLKPEQGSVKSPLHSEAEEVGDSHPTSALSRRPKQQGYGTSSSRTPQSGSESRKQNQELLPRAEPVEVQGSRRSERPGWVGGSRHIQKQQNVFICQLKSVAALNSSLETLWQADPPTEDGHIQIKVYKEIAPLVLAEGNEPLVLGAGFAYLGLSCPHTGDHRHLLEMVDIWLMAEFFLLLLCFKIVSKQNCELVCSGCFLIICQRNK